MTTQIVQPDDFPLGIAEDATFFNRTEKIAHLLSNIQNSKHTLTLLVAPRRYGKSSLAKHVIKLAQLPLT